MKMKIVLSAASELRKQMNANDFILFFPFAILVELNFGILIQFLLFTKNYFLDSKICLYLEV